MRFDKVFLEDVCLKITDGSHTSPKAVEKGYPMHSVKDMTDYGFDYSNTKQISEEDFLKLVKNDCKPLKNDVLIAKDGSYLKNVFVQENEKDEVILSSIAILRPNLEIILPEYLSYYLKNPQVKQTLKNGFVSGSVLPRIVLKDFKKLPIYIPKKNEQYKVVNILRLLDQKIINNKSMINNLENISSSLFKQWFFYFEFPNEQGLPYCSSGGEMVESEFGEIPKYFEVMELSTICEVKDGTHDSPKQVSEGFPLVTSKHLMENSIDFSTTKLISTEDYEKVNKRSQVNTNDILISMIGTVGKLYLVHDKEINFAIKNIGLIKTSQINDFEYIYEYFKSQFMQNYVKERTTGSTQQYISLTEMRKIPVLVPTTEVLAKYKRVVQNIYEGISSLVLENENLTKLRDTLLPKLLSGEIEIPDESVVDPS